MKLKTRFFIGLKKYKPNDLYVEVLSDNIRLRLELNITLQSEKNWDTSRQIVVRMPNCDQINDYLLAIRNKLDEYDLECTNSNRPILKDDIKRIVYGNPTETTDDNVIDVFRRYNKRDYDQKAIKYPSYQKYQTMFNNLQEFIDIVKNQKNSPFSFAELTPQFIDLLECHLQSKYEMSTVAKFHINLKKFIMMAVTDRYLKVDPYEKFKIKKAHTKERDVLTEAQLTSLEQLNRDSIRATDPRLEIVLDKFLLSCYCGLRIGDNNSLLKSEIKINEHGEMVIDKITEKMDGSRVILPVDLLFDGKGKEIVERYLVMYPDLPTLFPDIPDQKINARLKSLAVMIGVDFNLTFHIARHTCATLLAEKTGNPFVIKQILGHADIKTSMIYIHSSYSATRKGLENVIWSKNSKKLQQSSNDINMLALQSLEDICKQTGLSQIQTCVVIAEAIKNMDKIDFIGMWVSTLDPDVAPEAIIKKINILASR